ncbi:MAG TPA: chorismate synthase [Spirochaetia bacterium]|nr:chorismate synthase [Spirochaetia bacterium]
MPGSTFGRMFTITTFGESHGPGVGVVIDGVPPRIPLAVEDIQRDLDRRRPGQSAITTPRAEKDRVEILSGVFDGATTGTAISLLIRNEDKRSSDYDNLKGLYRPGHADWTYSAKFGIRDWRGSGRASGRETASRVAAGAVARKFLSARGITLLGYSREIAGIRAMRVDPEEVERNPARCPDPEAAPRMIEQIEKAKAENDSVGGIVEVVAFGCPAGLGDPVFDKLEALLGHAILSVGAVRGVEIGAGFDATRLRGSQYNDEPYMDQGRMRTRTNNAGGIAGGISNGMEIVVRAAMRPPASIARPQKTVDSSGSEVTVQIEGRHDPCIVPRAVPVIEAMTALVLADCLLVQEAYRT